MNRIFPGLDFGTTNSTLGLAGAGGSNAAPRLLDLEGSAPTLPSALFFSMEDGETYFGRAAVFEYTDGAEGRFMRALKSVLGSTLMEETTQVRRERLSYVDIIGRFLAHMRGRLEQEAERAAAGGEGAISLEEVVLGRPVRFVDEDDGADRTAQDQLEAAARAQGFGEIAFQFEPVAAALYYESTIAAEELALVVDVGGGTSDFTIVRLSPDRAKANDRYEDILSSSGVHVGGTDFDRLLSISSVMPSFGLGSETADGKRRIPVWYFNDMATWHRINTLYTQKTRRDIHDLEREAAEPAKLARYAHLLDHRSGHRLAGAVEAAKIALSDAPTAEVELDEPGLHLSQTVLRAAFEAATADLTASVEASIGEALRMAGIEADAIETVILTGGGTQVPALRTAALSRFPAARIAQSDAFGSVGLGLAIDAARKFA